MTWRPFVVVFALISALLVNAALIGQERIPLPDEKEVIKQREEDLRHVTYSARNRKQNFREFGMSDAMAEETAEFASSLRVERKRFRKMLEEQGDQVGDVFCAGTDRLPQPYAAMRYLVLQENERRDTIPYTMLFNFENQWWFDEVGRADAVYTSLERGARRKEDATLMGVAAVMLMREEEAITQRNEWATGILAGNFASLESEKPSLRRKIVQYFAMMHVFTELANDLDGICR